MKNTIFQLRDRASRWQEDDDDMVAILEDYFGEVFHASRKRDDEFHVAECITSRLSETDQYILEKSFIREEVYCALKDMGPTKALEPN